MPAKCGLFFAEILRSERVWPNNFRVQLWQGPSLCGAHRRPFRMGSRLAGLCRTLFSLLSSSIPAVSEFVRTLRWLHPHFFAISYNPGLVVRSHRTQTVKRSHPSFQNPWYPSYLRPSSLRNILGDLRNEKESRADIGMTLLRETPDRQTGHSVSSRQSHVSKQAQQKRWPVSNLQVKAAQ